MILENEINLIKDEEIKKATKEFIIKYEDKIKEQPTSLSGKYHTKDPIVEIHLKRAVWFADKFCLEFNIKNEQRDVIIAATLLHDIGNYECSEKNNRNLPFFWPATNWGRTRDIKLHPLDAKDLILNSKMKRAEDIGRLVACHMSHWYNNCPQPRQLDEYIICASDYFASREEVDVIL